MDLKELIVEGHEVQLQLHTHDESWNLMPAAAGRTAFPPPIAKSTDLRPTVAWHVDWVSVMQEKLWPRVSSPSAGS